VSKKERKKERKINTRRLKADTGCTHRSLSIRQMRLQLRTPQTRLIILETQRSWYNVV